MEAKGELLASPAAFWEVYSRYAYWSRRIPGLIVYDWTTVWAKDVEAALVRSLKEEE
jgi:hypothetical protein